MLKFDRAGNLVDDFGNDTPYDGADMCQSPWPTDAFARPKDPGAGLVSRYRGTECEHRLLLLRARRGGGRGGGVGYAALRL